MSNLKPWKPGQTGNPGGRTKLPDSLKAIQSLTPLEVCKLVSKYARMTFEELELAAVDKRTPVVELAIASIFANSVKLGDFTRLAFLLDRAIGKAPTSEPQLDETEARSDLKELSTDELLRLVQAKLPESG